MSTTLHTPMRAAFGLTALALAFSTAAFAQPRDGAIDPQQPIQARPGGPDVGPGSEKTVDVAKGTRLVLSNQAGEVVVRSWDQDRVRIQATHSARETISGLSKERVARPISFIARRSAGRCANVSMSMAWRRADTRAFAVVVAWRMT